MTANYTRTMTSQLVSETSFGYRNTPEVAPVDTMPDPISKLQRGPNGFARLGSLYHTATLNQLDLYPQLTFTGVPGTGPNGGRPTSRGTRGFPSMPSTCAGASRTT